MNIPKINGQINSDKIKILQNQNFVTNGGDISDLSEQTTDVQNELDKISSVDNEINPQDNTNQNSQETQDLQDAQIEQTNKELTNIKSNQLQSRKGNASDILQFATDYNKILVDTVIPGLAPFDKERKFKLKLATLASLFFVVVGICILLFLHGNRTGELAGLAFGMAFTVWQAIKKKFEKKLKKLVMPLLMKAFPGFYWQESQTIETHEINSIRIFANSINAQKNYDDAFCGKFQDVDIDITECSYTTGGKNKVTIFNGAIVRLKMNKNFKGITIVRPKNSYMNCKDLERLNLEEVKLEDIEFCKEYRVFSTDQIEARYLLTTSFMERFKNMNFAFYADGSYCVFCGKYVYIAPSTHLDLFDLFNLKKPVTDRKQFDIMFNQIYSILKLVEHFKLNQKIGL